jgi:hypothetical protein
MGEGSKPTIDQLKRRIEELELNSAGMGRKILMKPPSC